LDASGQQKSFTDYVEFNVPDGAEPIDLSNFVEKAYPRLKDHISLILNKKRGNAVYYSFKNIFFIIRYGEIDSTKKESFTAIRQKKNFDNNLYIADIGKGKFRSTLINEENYQMMIVEKWFDI